MCAPPRSSEIAPVEVSGAARGMPGEVSRTKIHRIFLHDFWRKILLIFVRETSPGMARAAPETSTSAISYVFGRAHTCSRPGQLSKTDLLTLEHGIATGPLNCATFQSAGPRAGLLKLETCTVSVGSSPG